MYTTWCWSKVEVAALAICLALVSGCAPAVRVVEGKVTLDGKALPSGAIDFEPADSRNKVFGGDIKEGRYRIEIPPAQAQGTSVVRILSPQPTGRKVPAGPPAAPGAMIDEIAEAIPRQYNTSSTLKVDLSMANPHDFELFSRSKPEGNGRPARN
jgi:hypothetical protein